MSEDSPSDSGQSATGVGTSEDLSSGVSTSAIEGDGHPAGLGEPDEATAGDAADSTAGESAPGIIGQPTGGKGDRTAATASRPRRVRRQLISWAIVLLVAAGFAVGLRTFVVQTFFVPSGSMYPTLQVSDRILVLKIGFTIHRGDILVFRRPPGDQDDPTDEDLVKRVVGLPGEVIWSVGNTIYINGKPLAEPYLPKGTQLGRPIPKERIPANDYYMLGDNRTNSDDSRYWGFLPRSYVVGKVFLIIWRHGGPAFHVE